MLYRVPLGSRVPVTVDTGFHERFGGGREHEMRIAVKLLACLSVASSGIAYS